MHFSPFYHLGTLFRFFPAPLSFPQFFKNPYPIATICPRSLDQFYICKILYKKGHYFLDIPYSNITYFSKNKQLKIKNEFQGPFRPMPSYLFWSFLARYIYPDIPILQLPDKPVTNPRPLPPYSYPHTSLRRAFPPFLTYPPEIASIA